MSNRTSLLSSLSNGQLDVFAAVVGLGVSLALVPLWMYASGVYVLTIPVVVASACALYLASVRNSGAIELGWTTARAGTISAQVTGIAIAGLVVAVATVGERSLPILLFAGVIGSAVLLQIVFLDAVEIAPGRILAQILALSAVIRYAGLFTTPGLIGVDSWTHVTQYSASIASTGSLAAIAETKYVAAPFYHLTTVAGTQLLDVPIRIALFLVVGGAVVLSPLLLYAGARYFTTARWALFATALFVLGDHVIRWGLHLIPTSLGLVFFLGVLLYVARVLHAETGVLDHVLLALLAAAVTLTHQLSAFVTLTFLGAAVIAQLVVGTSRFEPAPYDDRRADAAVSEPVNLLGVFLFHLGFTLLVWYVTPSPTDEPFLTRMPRLLWTTVTNSAGFLAGGGSTAAEGAAATASSGGLLAAYADAAGFLMLLFVAIVGSLALLRWHRSLQASVTVIAGVVVMLVFALVLPLFGVETFIPGRWFAFLYALMAIVGAIGFRHVAGRFSSRTVVAVLVIFALAFPAAMVTAEKATIDNPTFEEEWPRFAYTQSELDTVGTIDEIVSESAGAIHADHPYRTVFERSGAHPSNTLTVTADGVPETSPQFIVYRSYQSSGASQYVTESGAVVTTQYPREQVCPPTRNYVYASEDTMLCTRSDR